MTTWGGTVGSQRPAIVVEVADDVRETLSELGPEAGAAVAELCRRLTENPRLGDYDTFTTLYRTQTGGSGGVDLSVVYLYGPPYAPEGVVLIGSVAPVVAPVPAEVKYGEFADGGEPPEPEPEPVGPRTEETAARQVSDAWRRVAGWLAGHAPQSAAALRPGASGAEIAVVEEALGVPVPASLKALWGLCAGVDQRDGAVFLLGNWALMGPGSAVEVHRSWMEVAEEGLWRPFWIPFASWDVYDHTSGLYLDARTGEVCSWGEFGERCPQYASLTVYLEDMADALEAPSLAGYPEPGLISGSLLWGLPSDPGQAALWEPLTG